MYLFSIIVLAIYMMLLYFLYEYIIKGEAPTHKEIKRSVYLNVLYEGIRLLFVLFVVYLLMSVFQCLRHYKNDLLIMKHYKDPQKKVKDMAYRQKKLHTEHMHAVNRIKFYTCGADYTLLKMSVVISAILSYAALPFARERRSHGAFFLFALLAMPVMMFVSISLVILSKGMRSQPVLML